MPKAKDMRPILAKAVQKHGTLAEIAQRMGLRFEGCRTNYWTKERAKETILECQKQNKLPKYLCPSVDQLQRHKPNAHTAAIVAFGTFEKMQSELKLEGQQKLSDRKIAKYDAKVAENFIRLEPYRGDVPTFFYCKTHHKMFETNPCNIWNSGQKLKCCLDASRREVQQKRNEKARGEYAERIKEKNSKVEALDDYINNSTPIRHRCLVHDEIHFARPYNVLYGYGLKCCAGGNVDTIEALLDGSFYGLQMESEFYIYDLANFKDYLKPGIDSTGHRPDEEYGEFLRGYPGLRPNVWLLEQAVLHETKNKADFPAKLDGWEGYTEIRKMPLNELTPIAEYLHNQLLELGMWSFAYQFVPMTTEQKKECQRRAEEHTISQC